MKYSGLFSESRLDAGLSCPMDENDANAKTIKEYLFILLYKLWKEDEGFSGKRPFGNSGWSFELYQPLIKNNIVDYGTLDEDGYVDELPKNIDVFVSDMIIRIFTK